MGLVYVSSESAAFMSALKTNLSAGKEAMNQLKVGSQKVVSAVDGHQLAGAAYTAGKGLFSQLIIPTITRTTNALEKVEQELQKYKAADSFVSGEGKLDEDKLNKEIQTLQSMKRSIDSTRDFVQSLSRNNPVANVVETYLGIQRNLTKQSETMQSNIRDTEKKLRMLREFNGQTSGLFKNSLNELKIAMQAVLVLNNTTVNADGSYSLPIGTDKSWFTQVKSPAKEAEKYGIKEGLEDFKGGLSPSEFSKESFGTFLEKTADKVLKEGKNIGKSWGAKLQPKVNGKFVKDTLRPRRWLSGKLKGMSNGVSNVVGKSSKYLGKGLIALGAYAEYKEFYDEHKNVGRALTYSAVATGVGVAAGSIGTALGGVAASAFAGTAIAGVATVGLPVVGAVALGAAATVGVKALYNNFKPFKNLVDGTGDVINKVGNKVKDTIGKAFSSPLKSLKGAFGW